MKIELERKKPRNLVAKDLRTPKYRMRVVFSKKKQSKRLTTFEMTKELHYENQ
jgi:hypothetical protein